MLMAEIRKVKTLEDMYEPHTILKQVAENLDNLFIRNLKSSLQDREKELLGEIWKMSQALYNHSIESNDVAMSNFHSLEKINQYCAKLLTPDNRKE